VSGPWRRASRLWLVVPVGLLLAALAFGRLERPAAPGRLAADAAGAEADGLRSCREEGEGAASDEACRAVWRAARARFLGARP